MTEPVLLRTLAQLYGAWVRAGMDVDADTAERGGRPPPPPY